uniref:Tyrosinase A n=1 Tax=Leptochiton asellus TaxID=211853 RepID=A0A0Y0DNT4_9MOLL|nr:tyrosinase A [Leptochiton asellus]
MTTLSSPCRFLMMILYMVLYVDPGGRVYATVSEGYVDWDYILCVEDEGMRMVSKNQEFVNYNEEVLEYACVEKFLYPKADTIQLNVLQQSWLDSLISRTETDIDLAASGQVQPRERKEYRMLSTGEREDFNNAVNQLKRDRNKYDALASLHVGSRALSAHRGPGFFTWHRLFLLLFENALKEYNSIVVLPYWDPTLDSALEDPKTSIMWDASHMGNGNGFVTTGPFSQWTNQDGRTLTRNIGESGRLIRPGDVDKVLSKRNFGQISFPNADPEANLELHSYGVQMWVGGDMGRLATAANDPLYFLLHAYIDCVWEKFRQNQTNPETDWPWQFEGNAAHSYNAFLLIMPNIRSGDVRSDRYGANIYTCVDLPSYCSGTCDSTSLRCDISTSTCQTMEIPVAQRFDAPCVGTSGYQNSYCLDGNSCNEAEWAYIPTEIVYSRPPDYSTYNSYPLYSPSWVLRNDIYSPIRFRSQGDYKTLEREYPINRNPNYVDCKCKESDDGRAYLQSFGLNYMGSYREYVPVDRRLPASSVVGYVAVKRPTVGQSTRSLIRVYDDCGRICTAVCFSSDLNEYTNCSGIVDVASNEPLNYGNTFEDALYIAWNYGTDNLPKQTDRLFLKFYCNYRADWPFMSIEFSEDPAIPRPDPPEHQDERPRTTTTTTVATTTTTTTTTTTPTTTVLIEPLYCFNSSECYKDYEPTGCIPCVHETFSPCFDDESRFRQCTGTVWVPMRCYPSYLVWDQKYSICNWRTWVMYRDLWGRRKR